MQLAHQLALANKNITADMIEATEFPHLVGKYQVRGVPRTVVNETVYLDGAMPEEQFVTQILEAIK